MIVLMQVQNIIRFIEYIERGKPYSHQFRNACNANFGYPVDVKTVYLPSQRGYLLKQRNADIRFFRSIFRVFIGPMHIWNNNTALAYSFFYAISFNTFYTVLCIGYFRNGIWEKASAKCGNNPEFLNPYPGNLRSSPEQG